MHRYLYMRRYAPFGTFGGGFEGDHRDGPSTDTAATARTVGVAMFGPNGVESYTGYSSGTAWMPAAALAPPRLSPFPYPSPRKINRVYGKVNTTISKLKVNGNTISFTMHTEGANPMVPGAPDIDTFVDFEACFGDGMHYKGRVRGDSFPNAEIFVLERSGRTIPLFDFRTKGGRNTGPFSRLFGSGSDNVLGRFEVVAPESGPMPPAKTVQG